MSALQGVSRFIIHAEVMCVCLQSGLFFYDIHLTIEDDLSSVIYQSIILS